MTYGDPIPVAPYPGDLTYTTNSIRLDKPLTESFTMADALEVTEAYTCNRITLAQACGLLASQLGTATALLILGHRFTDDELSAIEIGFDGKANLWLESNTPKGWWSLFRDNYKQYKRVGKVRSKK